MEQKKKTNFWIVGGALLLLIIGGYYSYLDDQKARNNGLYSIATVEKVQIAKGGWRIWMKIAHKQINFQESAVYFYEYFSLKSVGNRYFAKINYNENKNRIDAIRLVPIVQVPDSLQIAPSDGWTEEWMKEHFPKVVEYVHDTR